MEIRHSEFISHLLSYIFLTSSASNETDESDHDSGEDEDLFPSGKDRLLHPPNQVFTDKTVTQESRRNPQVLIGWEITVPDKGPGIVIGIKKSIGRPTKFHVQFKYGIPEHLSLKRGPNKGSIPFRPIRKSST